MQPLTQRHRSKSMGSFAEIGGSAEPSEETPSPLVSPRSPSMNAKSSNSRRASKHRPTMEEVAGHIAANPYATMDHSTAASPIYKDLAEMSRKLSVMSFGPSRRPNMGYVHCVVKVETNELKGVAAFPFKWDEFGERVERTQLAPLTYHGVPLYDKTGSPV